MVEPVVHVVDDDDAVRESIALLLEVEGLVVQTYDTAVRLLSRIDRLEPGCIVTDVRMPEMSGMELVRRLSELRVDMPVIVMTGHADVPLAVEAMKAGVVDFIEKPFDDHALINAIRSALDRTAERSRAHSDAAAICTRMAALSARERDVLDGLIEGKSNKVIAYDLGISSRTVEVYRANVMTKMHANSLSELVRMALLAGRA
jgi:two-component system response regulator FixJ